MAANVRLGHTLSPPPHNGFHRPRHDTIGLRHRGSMPAAAVAVIPAPMSRGYQSGTDWGRDACPPAPLPAVVDVTDYHPS
jgi:hypothetical protein